MIDKTIKFALGLLLLVLPLYILPFTNQSVESDKQILVAGVAFVSFGAYLLKIVSEKRFTIIRTPLDLLIILLTAISLISAIVFAPNRTDALFSPMGSLTILALALLYFTLTNSQTLHNFNFYLPLSISTVVISLITIMREFKLLPNYQPLPGNITIFSFLAISTGFFLTRYIQHHTLKLFKLAKSNIYHIVVLLATLSAVSISGFHLFFDQKPATLPFPFGWAIMMEMFKNLYTFFFGVGPADFSYAYTLAKPVALNLTPFWNVVFTNSTNLPLTWGTEIGAFGGLIFLVIFYKVLRFSSSPSYAKSSLPFLVSVIVALTLQLLYPTTVTVFALTMVFLGLAVPKKEGKKISLPAMPVLNLLPLILLVPLFYQGKYYLADIIFRQAVTTISAQNPESLSTAYQKTQTAISFNNRNDRFYTFSSALSLEMARSLSQSKNASESAQMISNLTQRAVNHARAATQVNPLGSSNWAQLSSVYQAMIGSVQGAEQSTLDALNNQMRLDPNSPQSRLTAGQIYLAAQQGDMAANYFSQAINLKPDWNIARYSMAQLFSRTGRYADAAAELQRTLDTTPQDSEDYKKIQQELEQVKKLIPPESTPSAQTNQPNQATQTPPSPSPKAAKPPAPSTEK